MDNDDFELHLEISNSSENLGETRLQLYCMCLTQLPEIDNAIWILGVLAVEPIREQDLR